MNTIQTQNNIIEDFKVLEGDLENLFRTGFIDTNIRVKTTRSRKKGDRLFLCRTC